MLGSLASTSFAKKQQTQKNLADLDYRVYPRRTAEEAAVLEWGHSAIISALDASVALFGPQTTQAALLEVECMPILASPLNGVGDRRSEDSEESDEIPIRALDNADDVHGNMVVMTNNGGLSGFGMAKVAKLSGAAALLVVNIDEKRPDDIHRLELLEGEEDNDGDTIDIPVVMVSLNSANVLTTATVTSNMVAADIVNNGMPDRVRLYSGGDRPFFEDVEPVSPTLYLIHNLLTEEEADSLVSSAQSKVSPVEQDDLLQMTNQAEHFPGVERVMLWQGLLQSPGGKAIEERVEQVTGFPAVHYSDWVVDRLDSAAHWKPHYDTHPYLGVMATITVFLTENGGPIVYPSSKKPVKVAPRKGMAIVHHNLDEKHEIDYSTVHAMMPQDSNSGDTGPIYVARKYIFTTPVSKARRIALPLFAMPFGGKLPSFVSSFHDFMLEKFGSEQGGSYFDKACVFAPILLVLMLIQSISEYVQAQVKASSDDKKKKKEDKSSRRTKKGKKE
jgi:hypothetical protein